MRLAAETFWRIPARFGFAQILGPSYSLRCVVFHNISPTDSPFTKGINVRTTPEEFEAALRFLTAYYTPVYLDQVLSDSNGRSLPPRAVLVTFDDAYASVAELALPLCRQYGVPAVFFVNAAFLDNQRLAADNLVCYVANVQGMKIINAAARAVRNTHGRELYSLGHVFTSFLPSLTLSEREAFLEQLRQLGKIDDQHLAAKASLYLSRAQVRALGSCDFEIGNHTYSHVHCRSLSQADFAKEIDANKVELEALSGKKVWSFSQPYGSSRDLTGELRAYLERSGYKAVFLSESVANPRGAEAFSLDRVNPRTRTKGTLFFDLEVMPRLRHIRNALMGKPTFRGNGMKVPVAAS